MSDDNDKITACPECDSPSISSNVCTNYPTPAPSHEWHCKDCNETFDQPERRAVHPNATRTWSGPAKKLVDADPDDYPRGDDV